MTDAQARLNSAKDLYKKGQLTESEALFQSLLDEKPLRAQALAALGLISVQRSAFDDAGSYFASSLQSGFNADAHYGLGVLAERNGRLADAVVHFSKAVDCATPHTGARRSLDRLRERMNGGPQPAPSPTPAPTPPPASADRRTVPQETDPEPQPSPAAKSRGGLYPSFAIDAAKRNSPSAELSRECMRLIDEIQGRYRPRRSAYPISTVFFWLNILGYLVIIPLFLFQTGIIR